MVMQRTDDTDPEVCPPLPRIGLRLGRNLGRLGVERRHDHDVIDRERRQVLSSQDDRGDRLYSLNAQNENAAAMMVMIRKCGSFARELRSSKKRQTWTSASNPKTIPVVRRYVLIEFVPAQVECGKSYAITAAVARSRRDRRHRCIITPWCSGA